MKSMKRCGTCLHAMFCRDRAPGCKRYRARDRLTHAERMMLLRYEQDKLNRQARIAQREAERKYGRGVYKDD